jgi:hypothetical protein
VSPCSPTRDDVASSRKSEIVPPGILQLQYGWANGGSKELERRPSGDGRATFQRPARPGRFGSSLRLCIGLQILVQRAQRFFGLTASPVTKNVSRGAEVGQAELYRNEQFPRRGDSGP